MLPRSPALLAAQHIFHVRGLSVKSVSLNLFILVGSSSSSSVDASSFGCIILSLYLTLNFVISSLIVGTVPLSLHVRLS